MTEAIEGGKALGGLLLKPPKPVDGLAEPPNGLAPLLDTLWLLLEPKGDCFAAALPSFEGAPNPPKALVFWAGAASANGLSRFVVFAVPRLDALPKPNGLAVVVAGVVVAKGLATGFDELCVGCPNEENIWRGDATAVAFIYVLLGTWRITVETAMVAAKMPRVDDKMMVAVAEEKSMLVLEAGHEPGGAMQYGDREA